MLAGMGKKDLAQAAFAAAFMFGVTYIMAVSFFLI